MDINNIKQMVANAFGTSVTRMNSRSRKEPIASARLVCYYYGRRILGLTYKDIGRSFSRTHGAVIRGERKIENIRSYDPSFQRILDDLEATYF